MLVVACRCFACRCVACRCVACRWVFLSVVCDPIIINRSTNHPLKSPTHNQPTKIKQVISSLTASLRFDGALNVDITEFQVGCLMMSFVLFRWVVCFVGFLIARPRTHFDKKTLTPLSPHPKPAKTQQQQQQQQSKQTKRPTSCRTRASTSCSRATRRSSAPRRPTTSS